MGHDREAADDGAPGEAYHTRLRHYCGHDRAREIRMYTSYADANAVRLRLSSTSDGLWRHVSQLYEIPNGWAWTVCNECPDSAARSPRAVGE
ncbi:MAG TPA: hypothetical protein VHZ49_04065 [Methylomirabilota bacterium]|jgi:hypothetical protein|nr:hypothetical protein [Methylomirabilota bacterium]